VVHRAICRAFSPLVPFVSTLGLRPRLVYVGPLALDAATDATLGLVYDGPLGLMRRVGGPKLLLLTKLLFSEGPDAFGFAYGLEDGEVGGRHGLFGRFHTVAVEKFEGESAVGFGSSRARVVEGYGLAVAGGFGEADIARNGGFEDLVTEEANEVVADLLGEVGAVVEHSEEDAFEREAGVEAGGDAIEGGHELGYAFEGEIFGLHGDEEGVGGDEGVEGEEIEGGRTVEEDEGVGGADGLECLAEAGLAALGGDELDVGADHVFCAGNEEKVGNLRGEDDFAGGGVTEEKVVHGGSGFIARKAETASGVCLGIDIEEKDWNALECNRCGQVDGGSGFSYATLLVDDGDDFGVGLCGRIVQVNCFGHGGMNLERRDETKGSRRSGSVFHVERQLARIP
jgi:hypothetical protein